MKIKTILLAAAMGLSAGPVMAQQSPFVFEPTNNTGSGQNRSPGTMPQILDDGAAGRAQVQNQGIFSPLPRQGAGPLGVTQDAWSDPQSNKADGQHQPGVVRFSWSSDLIMPIRLREAMVTSIVIPEWDGIADVIIGDGVSFEAMRLQPNVAGLRAMATGVDTTVQIIGKASGNLYTFYVRSETYNTEAITDILVYVNVSRAPGTEMRRLSGSASEPAVRLAGDRDGTRFAPFVAKDPLPESAVFDLRLFGRAAGDEAIAPQLVYSDPSRGWTYFDFGDKAHLVERPVVFQLKDGIETRVNTRTIGRNGEILVVEAVGEFVLRAGQKVVCVKRIDA